MKRGLLMGFLLFLMSGVFLGQEVSDCPTLRMEAPRETFVPEVSISYLATVDRRGWDAPLEYRWTASWPDPKKGGGRVEAIIEQGQGTPWIRILKPGNQITAQVEVIGFPKGCANTASETAGWNARPEPKKLYAGSSSWNSSLLEDLADIARRLNNDPNSQLFAILAYKNYVADKVIDSDKEQIRNQFMRMGIGSDRVTFEVFRKGTEAVQLWLVSPGADNPRCLECVSPTPRLCPAISIDGPAGVPLEGEPIHYSGRVDSNDPNLKFFWSVSSGTISKGQGTLNIEVINPTRPPTVNLTVAGLPNGGPDSTSEAMIIDPTPQAVKIDEFMGPLDRIATSRFEVIRRRMSENPNAQVHVFLTASSSSSMEAKRAVLVRELVGAVHDQRITFVNVGVSSNRIAVWLVPPGADLPDSKKWLAETNELTCPKISVTGPAGIPERGKPIPFTATVTGDLPTGAVYRWNITGGGEIADGQGTLVLRAWMPDDGSNLTATFEVIGLKSGCPATASETIGISHGGMLFSKPKQKCPTIFLEGPPGMTRTGERAKVRVKIHPDNTNIGNLVYEWSTDRGKIDRGNGTPEIEITTDEIDPRGENVTVTVNVKGLPAGCPNTAVDMFGVIQIGPPFVVDEYGVVPLNEEKARIDNVGIQLRPAPDMVALYILKGPKSQSRASFEQRIQRILARLKNPLGIERSRVVFAFSNAERVSTIVYLLPRSRAKSWFFVDYDLSKFRPKR